MSFKATILAAAIVGIAVPSASFAQGLVGGAENGANRGAVEAGPVGAVVGGAVGAATGTVNGALGLGGPAAAPCGSRTVRQENAVGESRTTTTTNCP